MQKAGALRKILRKRPKPPPRATRPTLKSGKDGMQKADVFRKGLPGEDKSGKLSVPKARISQASKLKA
jgi:hypothetical protein